MHTHTHTHTHTHIYIYLHKFHICHFQLIQDRTYHPMDVHVEDCKLQAKPKIPKVHNSRLLTSVLILRIGCVYWILPAHQRGKRKRNKSHAHTHKKACKKKKSLSLNEKYWRTVWKKLGEWTISQKREDKAGRATGLDGTTREEIGWGNQNASPEIPGRGNTSDIPSLPGEIGEGRGGGGGRCAERFESKSW